MSKNRTHELYTKITSFESVVYESYQPHVKRMFEEFTELYERHQNLNTFIEESPIFVGLSTKVKHLRVEQRASMYQYKRVLAEIIFDELEK